MKDKVVTATADNSDCERLRERWAGGEGCGWCGCFNVGARTAGPCADGNDPADQGN